MYQGKSGDIRQSVIWLPAEVEEVHLVRADLLMDEKGKNTLTQKNTSSYVHNEQEQTKFDDLRRGIAEDFQRLAKFK